MQGGQGLCTKKSQRIWAEEDKWVGSGSEWTAMRECGLAAYGRKGQRDEQERPAQIQPNMQALLLACYT